MVLQINVNYLEQGNVFEKGVTSFILVGTPRAIQISNTMFVVGTHRNNIKMPQSCRP